MPEGLSVQRSPVRAVLIDAWMIVVNPERSRNNGNLWDSLLAVIVGFATLTA